MIDNGVYTPAHVLASGIRSGSLSSAAVVGAAIARAREINPRLNAVIALDEAAAMQSARAADEAVRNGCEIGPLHGLPITIKDCFEVGGFAAVNGAPELQGYRPRRHAPAVQRIVDAGAIVIGKTNVPRYSLDLQTFNDVFGVTRNPWDPARTPGGSCGGAAVALATGVTSLELGTDLAGSLRIPAHSTGVCSLKPSFGVVPVSGVLSNVPGLLRRPDLVVAGPMARTVADLELLLDVVAGPTAPDAAGWRLDLPPSRRQPGELRVAAWLDDDICPVEQGMAAVLDAACRALDEDGVAMDRDARPAFEASEYFRTYLQLMYAEMSAGFPEGVFRAFAAAARRNAEHSGWTPLTLMPWAVTQGHREWLAACERRERYRAAWADFFARYDVLVTPVAPTTAPPHDPRPFEERTIRLRDRDYAYMQQAFWCGLATAACLPAAVVPIGRAADGLPVGLQIIGPYLADRTVLAFAATLERLCGGFQAPPELAG